MTDRDLEITSLVARAQRGESECVGKLFELLSNRIFRFFSVRTNSREVAEDLTQTVFLEMIQALPRYKVRTGTRFSTWLFQIARFRLIDHYRKQRPSVSLDDVPEPSHQPFVGFDPFDTDRVVGALRELPEKYQTVLHLRFREGLPAREIAQILGTTALNVRVLQFRALRTLRGKLQAYVDSVSVPKTSYEHT